MRALQLRCGHFNLHRICVCILLEAGFHLQNLVGIDEIRHELRARKGSAWAQASGHTRTSDWVASMAARRVSSCKQKKVMQFNFELQIGKHNTTSVHPATAVPTSCVVCRNRVFRTLCCPLLASSSAASFFCWSAIACNTRSCTQRRAACHKQYIDRSSLQFPANFRLCAVG